MSRTIGTNRTKRELADAFLHPQPIVYLCLTCRHCIMPKVLHEKPLAFCFSSGEPRELNHLGTKCFNYSPEVDNGKS